MKQTYLLLGMAIQALVAGSLDAIGAISITPCQQLSAGFLFLFLALQLKPKKKREVS